MILISVDARRYSRDTRKWTDLIHFYFIVFIKGSAPDDGQTFHGTHEPFHILFLALFLIFSTSLAMVLLH